MSKPDKNKRPDKFNDVEIEPELDPEEKKRQLIEQYRKAARAQELEDIKFLVQSESGLRVLRRIVAITGVFTTSFRADENDRMTAFREGGRNVALILVSDVAEIAPAKLNVIFQPERTQRNDGAKQ